MNALAESGIERFCQRNAFAAEPASDVIHGAKCFAQPRRLRLFEQAHLPFGMLQGSRMNA